MTRTVDPKAEPDQATDNEALAFLREAIAAGEHWYVAVLKTMARWSQAEETVDGRRYRYLIGGEAFDWLVLAERLIDALDGDVAAAEREALLFHGQPPIEVDEEEFQALIGTPKYQAFLNYLYGVLVEEALQQAVEEEVEKERHGAVWARFDAEGATTFGRIYGRSQVELLGEFQRERGLEETDWLELGELKEFTYWLFKYRVRSQEGERVASDTRKGLAALSRVEAAFRRRSQPEVVEAPPAAPARRRRRRSPVR